LKDDLTDANFLLFCAKHYMNPSATTDLEFIQDVRRIKYTKKLISRYRTTGDLKERLILNHLTVLNNVFGAMPLARIIWLKMDGYLPEIKPFMIALGILPKFIYNVRGKKWDTDDVPLDMSIVAVLRKIPK
jgi:hypothetical protein